MSDGQGVKRTLEETNLVPDDGDDKTQKHVNKCELTYL